VQEREELIGLVTRGALRGEMVLLRLDLTSFLLGARHRREKSALARERLQATHLIADAELTIERMEVLQDNENVQFLWITARKP
jgi:hypothetical protein